MDIEVDYNPAPQKMFFISAALNAKEAISFDFTSKGHRIIKQVLIGKKSFPKNKKCSSEWDAIVLKNGKLGKRKKYHVKWIDLGKKDWVNNEIWETLWEKRMPQLIQARLQKYSWFVSDHYTQIKKFEKEFQIFDQFIEKLVRKYAI